ncbi:MAG TPA: hypothetical protein DCM28_18185, partial [Phycisphaerales bacterium]|nr:hypothetical protein [Phycisphaerales bacterium]
SSLNSFVAQALFNGGLGAAFDDIADLTINAAGQIYAIRSEAGGQTSLLYKVNIDSDSGTITSFDLINQVSDTNGNLIVNITAVDADPESELLYAIGQYDGDDTRMLFTIDPSSGEAVLVGAVTAYGTTNTVELQISSLAWDNSGTMLFGVVEDFDGYEKLIRINPADGTYTDGGSVAPDVVEEQDIAVQIDMDTALAIVAAQDGSNTLWTLHQDNTNGYVISEITRDANGNITAISEYGNYEFTYDYDHDNDADATTSNITGSITNISSMTLSEDGSKLYFVGSTTDATSGDEYSVLFSVVTADAGAANTPVTLEAALTFNSNSISDTFKALVTVDANTLQGIRNIDGDDWLVKIDLLTDTVAGTTAGGLSNVGDGEVKVDEAGTNISALVYNVYGELLALDTTSNGNRIVMLSTVSPSSLSVALTRQGILADNMVGLSTDGNDQYFSIQDSNTANADRIFTNSTSRAYIEVGGQNPTQAVDVVDANDDGTPDFTFSFVDAVAIAMAEDGLTGYAVNYDDASGTYQLYTFTRDSVTGEINSDVSLVGTGTITDDGGPATNLTGIASMAINGDTLYLAADQGVYTLNTGAATNPTFTGADFAADDLGQIVDSFTGLAIDSDGNVYAAGAVDSATITFSANPTTGQTLTLNDGASTIVYEFTSTTGVSNGDILGNGNTAVVIGDYITDTMSSLLGQINDNHGGAAYAVDVTTNTSRMIRVLHNVSNTSGVLLSTASSVTVTNFGAAAQRDILLAITDIATTPTATLVGETVIEIEDQGTIITAMEFDAANRLVAISDAYGTDMRMMVTIDLADPFDGSAALSGVGSVGEDMVGLAADGRGRFYSIDDNSTLRASGIQSSGMDFSESNNLVVMDDSLNGDASTTGRRRLVFVDVNAPTHSVQATYPGAISDRLQGYASTLDGTYYSIFDNTAVDGGLTNNQLFRSLADNAPNMAVNGDLGDNYEFSAIAVTPDTIDGPGVVYAINTDTEGGTELYVLDDDRETASAARYLGQITDKFGAAITDILSMDSDENGILHLVGFNSQAPNPTTTVGQTSEYTAISEDFEPIAMTVTDSGRIFVVNDNGSDTDGDGKKDYSLLEITRTANLTGGIVTSIINHGIIQDPNDAQLGEDIQNIYTIETDPVTGKLYTVGTKGSSDSQQLFEINPINGVAQAVGTLYDEDGNQITNAIKALAAQEVTDEVPDQLDTVWVIDASGSTIANFGGTAVGDVNGDGLSNTILDAELAALINLNQQLIDQGQGNDAEISIVIFGTQAAIVDMDPSTPTEFEIVATPSQDFDGNGVPDIVDILQSIQIDLSQSTIGSGTNYEDALQKATSVFEQRGTVSGDGVLVFLSDGIPSVGNLDGNNEGNDDPVLGIADEFAYGDEVSELLNMGIELNAYSVGDSAALGNLQVIDPDAILVNTTDELTGSLEQAVNVGFVEFLAVMNGATSTDAQSLIEININPIDIDGDTNFEEIRVANRGNIEYDIDTTTTDQTTNIVDFDFNAQGELIAIEEHDFSGGANDGLRALLLIDQDNPATESRLTTDFGAVDGDLMGYASDEAGRFYSILDSDDQTNLDLWTNASILYTINPDDLNGPDATPSAFLDSDADGVPDLYDAIDANGDGLAEEVIATPVTTLSRPNPLSTDYVPITTVQNIISSGTASLSLTNLTLTNYLNSLDGLVSSVIRFDGQPLDGETIELYDGYLTYVFEFDNNNSVGTSDINGSVGVSNTNIAIGSSAAETMQNLVDALTDQSVAVSIDPSTVGTVAQLILHYNDSDSTIEMAQSLSLAHNVLTTGINESSTLTFNSNPLASQSITINDGFNSFVIVFGTDVAIGGTETDTRDNLFSYINNSANGIQATATVVGTDGLTITYNSEIGIITDSSDITITGFSSSATGDVVRGTITLSDNPTDGQTITINDGFNTVTFEFDASDPQTITLGDINPAIDLNTSFTVTRADGVNNFVVDTSGGVLTSSSSVQDLLDLINEAAANLPVATVTYSGLPNEGQYLQINDGTNEVIFEFDINDAFDETTPLGSLNAGNGLNLTQAFEVTYEDGLTRSIDLSSLSSTDTVQDLLNLLNLARAGVDFTGTISLTDGDTLVLNDGTTSVTFELDAGITTTTTLDELNNGTGVNLSIPFIVTLSSGAVIDMDLSALDGTAGTTDTVADLIALIEQQRAVISFNNNATDGETVTISDGTNSFTFEFSDGAISDVMLIGDLNDGAGVDLSNTFDVVLGDGTTYTLDLSSLSSTSTVGELRDLLNASRVSITLTDNLSDGDYITINDGTDDYIFEFDSGKLQATDLLVNLASDNNLVVTEALTITRSDATAIVLAANTFSSSSTVQDLLNAINTASTNKPQATLSLSNLPSAGETVTITVGEDDYTFTFVNKNVGSEAANEVSIRQPLGSGTDAVIDTILESLADKIASLALTDGTISTGIVGTVITLTYNANANTTAPTLAIAETGSDITATNWANLTAQINDAGTGINLVDATGITTTVTPTALITFLGLNSGVVDTDGVGVIAGSDVTVTRVLGQDQTAANTVVTAVQLAYDVNGDVDYEATLANLYTAIDTQSALDDMSVNDTLVSGDTVLTFTDAGGTLVDVTYDDVDDVDAPLTVAFASVIDVSINSDAVGLDVVDQSGGIADMVIQTNTTTSELGIAGTANGTLEGQTISTTDGIASTSDGAIAVGNTIADSMDNLIAAINTQFASLLVADDVANNDTRVTIRDDSGNNLYAVTINSTHFSSTDFTAVYSDLASAFEGNTTDEYGSITITDTAGDGDTITIYDGTNTPVIFEFDAGEFDGANLIGDLRDGAGIDLDQQFDVTLADGTFFTVDLSSLSQTDTVQALLNMISAQRAQMSVSSGLNDGDTITVTVDNGSGNVDFVFEIDSGIQTDTLLSEINSGAGITDFTGFTITRQDGVVITISDADIATAGLSSATATVADLLELINDHADNGFSSTITLTNQPLSGETITINGTIFEFYNTGGTVSGTNTAVLIGDTTVDTATNLAAGINALTDVTSTHTGLEGTNAYVTVTSSATFTVTDENSAFMVVSSQGQLVAQINATNTGIDLVDHTTGLPTLTVTAIAGGSSLADEIGIAGVDGVLDTDVDGTLNGTAISPALSNPGANNVELGATLAETIDNLMLVINNLGNPNLDVTVENLEGEILTFVNPNGTGVQVSYSFGVTPVVEAFAGVTATINSLNLGINITDVSTSVDSAVLTIESTNTTEDLGIAGLDGTADASVDGTIYGDTLSALVGLNSTVFFTESTQLGSLRDGNGIDTSVPFEVTFQDGSVRTYDLSSLTATSTVADLLELIGYARGTLELSANLDDSDTITVNDGTTEVTFEINTGIYGTTVLGVGGSNDGINISTFEDINVRLANGDVLTIIGSALTGTDTVADFINAVTNAQDSGSVANGGRLVATVNATNTGITLTDTTTGSTLFEVVTSSADTGLSVGLGLHQTDDTGVDGVIDGLDITPALTVVGNTAVIRGEDRAETVANIIAAINNANLNVQATDIGSTGTTITLRQTDTAANSSLTGSGANLTVADFATLTASIDTAGLSLNLADNSTDNGTTLSIASSTTSNQLGLSGIDGTDDQDSAEDGTFSGRNITDVVRVQTGWSRQESTANLLAAIAASGLDIDATLTATGHLSLVDSDTVVDTQSPYITVSSAGNITGVDFATRYADVDGTIDSLLLWDETGGTSSIQVSGSDTTTSNSLGLTGVGIGSILQGSELGLALTDANNIGIRIYDDIADVITALTTAINAQGLNLTAVATDTENGSMISIVHASSTSTAVVAGISATGTGSLSGLVANFATLTSVIESDAGYNNTYLVITDDTTGAGTLEFEINDTTKALGIAGIDEIHETDGTVGQFTGNNIASTINNVGAVEVLWVDGDLTASLDNLVAAINTANTAGDIDVTAQRVGTEIFIKHDTQDADLSTLSLATSDTVNVALTDFTRVTASITGDGTGGYNVVITDNDANAAANGGLAITSSGANSAADSLGLVKADAADGTDGVITGTADFLDSSYVGGNIPVLLAADFADTLTNLIDTINAQNAAGNLFATAVQSGSGQLSVIAQQNGLGANYDIVDTAINSAGNDELFMIDQTNDTLRLFSVTRDASFGYITSVNEIGGIVVAATDSTGTADADAGKTIYNVNAVDFDGVHDGIMYIIGSVDRTDHVYDNGSTTATEQWDEMLELFRVDTTTGEATSLGLLTDVDGENYSAADYQINAIASDPDPNVDPSNNEYSNLYAVLRHGAVDTLIVINVDPASTQRATFIDRGEFKVDNGTSNTNITAMDFVVEYERFGIYLERALVMVDEVEVNASTNEVERQILRFPVYSLEHVDNNTVTTSTTFDPSTDTQKILEQNVVRTSLDGYSSDSQGIFFSVMDQGDTTQADTLWTSQQYIAIAAQVQGLSFQTADGNPDNDFYTLINFEGQATPFTTDVSRPTPPNGHIIEMQQAFAELDLTTGRFTDPVQLLSANGFNPLSISDFDINAAGKIIGIDKSGGEGNTRLVQIDTDALYNEERELMFTNETGTDTINIKVPSILVHTITEDGAVDDNLVGYASSYDLNGEVYFYSIFDNAQMNNLLLRSYNDNGVGNAVNDVDHLPMPSLTGELTGNFDIEAMAIIGVQDEYGNDRIFFFDDTSTAIGSNNPFNPYNYSPIALNQVVRDANGNVVGSTTIGNVVDEFGSQIHSIFDAATDPTDPLIPTLTPARPLDLSGLLADSGSGSGGIDNTTSPDTFDIVLNISGDLTDAHIAAFVAAVDFWESVITADLPSHVDSNGILVDDLIIDASGVFIDGPLGILGQAGPTEIRDAADNYLPLRGIMQFDTDDLDFMVANGSLTDVIIHEMGHVLGIGTLWDFQGLLDDSDLANPYFTGAQATAAYESIFGLSGTAGVPVEQDGGPGTAYAHWDEETFDNELMTGYINNGVNPVSLITIASLADQGYTVDVTKAEAYSPPSSLSGLMVGVDAEDMIYLGGDALIYDENTAGLSGSYLDSPNYSHLVSHNDGSVFVITGTGLGATLSQIPVTNTSTINTIANISDSNALTQLLQVTAVEADPTNDSNNTIYGVGSTVDALLPTDLLTAVDLNVQALTVVSDNTVFIVSLNDNNTSGDTTDDYFELWRVTRDSTGTATSTASIGRIVDADGNPITEINSIASDSTGQLYVVGYNADEPITNVNVGDDFGGDFDVVGITADGQNEIFAMNLDRGPYIGLYNINRDTDGSLSDSDAYTFLANVTDSVNGFPLLNVRALADDGNGLFALGYSPDQLIPTNALGGSGTAVVDDNGTPVFTSTENLQGLAITIGDELLAVDLRSNGLTYLYKVDRDPTTKVVTAITLVDVVNNSGQAILGLTDIEAGEFDDFLVSVGYADGALLPSNLLQNISTLLDVRALAVTDDGDFYVVYKASDQKFHMAFLDVQTDNTFTFNDVGIISDTADNEIFDIGALEENNGTVFLVGVSASDLLPSLSNIVTDDNNQFDLGTNYSVTAISATNSDKNIFAINNEQSSAL